MRNVIVILSVKADVSAYSELHRTRNERLRASMVVLERSS